MRTNVKITEKLLRRLNINDIDEVMGFFKRNQLIGFPLNLRDQIYWTGETGHKVGWLHGIRDIALRDNESIDYVQYAHLIRRVSTSSGSEETELLSSILRFNEKNHYTGYTDTSGKWITRNHDYETLYSLQQSSDHTTVEKTYDEQGRLVRRIVSVGGSVGTDITQSYDPENGKLVQRSVNGDITDFVYDEHDNLVQRNTEKSFYTWVHDSSHKVTTETCSNGDTIEHSYSASGILTRTKHTRTGETWIYWLDDIGNIDRVSRNDKPVVEYSYEFQDYDGPLRKVYETRKGKRALVLDIPDFSDYQEKKLSNT
jgi:YD repeat-containing protein